MRLLVKTLLVNSATKVYYFCVVSLILLVQLTAFTASAQEKRDSVIFYHEQMILGELKSISEGRVSFDSDIVRVISIKNDKIKTLSASLHYYRIRTADDRIVYGTIHSSAKDGHVVVNQGTGKVEVSISDIITLERYDTKFFQRLTGNISVGYNFTKSTDIGRLSIAGMLRYLGQTYQSSLSVNTIMTQDQGTFSRDNSTVTNTNQLNFSYRWIGLAVFSYQRNLELGILRRYQEGLLIGYNISNFNNRQLSSSLGIAINQELTQDDESAKNLIEVPFILAFTFYQFHHPDIQLQLSQKMFFGVTQKGRIRNDANFNVNWSVIHDFTIGINIYANFDNQAAESSSSNFDFGVVLNVGYKF